MLASAFGSLLKNLEKVASMIRTFKQFIPRPLFVPYHFTLALVGALYYRFPSRKLFVIGITGTKGKSSTAEIVNAILEEEGHKTALASTIRFKIDKKSSPNRHKMTMPGRFFLQRFLRQATDRGCRYAILEMTSEGVSQFRHKFIELNALIFTNITPEHIEAHGSFAKYLAAKLKIKDQLEQSPKTPKWMIANTASEHADKFLAVHTAVPVPFSLHDAEPYRIRERGIDLTFGEVYMHSPLRGKANLENILAAAVFARTQEIQTSSIKRAVERLSIIPGRGEIIDEGQNFTVVVDYAHTTESLTQLYETYKEHRRICVLGATGGGRDHWKRPQFGKLAEQHCDEIILTDEDPYDEDPRSIVENIARGIEKKKPSIEMDRRLAIRLAIKHAEANDTILITGKGTDPYIMGPRGTKKPWSDAEVTRQELREHARHMKRTPLH